MQEQQSSRRDFLKTSGTLAAGAALGAGLNAAPETQAQTTAPGSGPVYRQPYYDLRTPHVQFDPDVSKLPNDGKLRIICFGGHPDDCELQAGGASIFWSRAGHHVAMVSTTNGELGHWETSGGAVGKRRYNEIQKAAEILGVEKSVVWDNHCSELEPTLENRKKMIRDIRRWRADIVMAHRLYDYNVDHRYTGTLMIDSAFSVEVPMLCTDTPPLETSPLFLFYFDLFTRPCAFRPDIVIAIDDVVEQKIDALATMESQFVDGGALGYLDPRRSSKDPKVREELHKEHREIRRNQYAARADFLRDRLVSIYGEPVGSKVKYAEAFEICEYGYRPKGRLSFRDPPGGRLTVAEWKRFFPFVPIDPSAPDDKQL